VLLVLDFLLTVLALVSPLAQERASASGSPQFPGEEGPLANDSYLPVSESATRQLARGDALLLELRGVQREGAVQSADRGAWSGVFDAWRAALSESRAGDCAAPRPELGSADLAKPGAAASSPWPDPDGTASRRTEGVELAVLRRLASLSPAERKLWIERFETLARERLGPATAAAASFDAAPAAALEREFPATESAARAALVLAELALEEGRSLAAVTQCERGLRHLELAGLRSTPLGGALEQRRDLARRWSAASGSAQRAAAPAAWQRAQSLAPLAALKLFTGGESAPRREDALLGSGLQPGLVFLEDGRALIQLPDRICVLDPALQAITDTFRMEAFLAPCNVEVRLAVAPAEPPGWILQPATDGRSVVVVEGQNRGASPNALVCFSLEPASPGARGVRVGEVGSQPAALPARLRWLVHDDRTFASSGGGTLANEWPADLALHGGEFQPGPLVWDTLVLAQVREGEARDGAGTAAGQGNAFEPSCWLVALELKTGRPLWKRFLAKGSELAQDRGRFFTPQRSARDSTAGQTLVALDGEVFAGTHLGAGALLSAADGRFLWTLKNRRRAAERRSWPGWSIAPGPSSLLWAPADGDHLYWLRAPDDSAQSLQAASLFERLPRSIGEAEAVLGGDRDSVLVLSRSGPRRTLSRWGAESGERRDALELAPEERFSGPGLVSAERALFATDRGLYLFDRARDLLLLDYQPLAQLVPRGGGVFARGDRVVVLGGRNLWLFAALEQAR
jgi:hypothetical protein